ncbi:uncharacterized protein SPSC_05752 [Sporisorium scitamineum]|uniref:DUF833-domain-containing protein n=1 Tax=Sporisorium scitamineum TaxID=49012 RepID=A0A0F7S4G7_9BASI|nr:uncharacterized protein SPSC_05752 [Sporisorium scitamineum]CDS01892.1 hypothetical protein [Sporisorium scitamineum]
MCVIFWTVNDPTYDLVIASNRDEFLSRPTLSADWHSFQPLTSSSSKHDILSARDATGGGTWLGVTRNGAFATLTNFTEVSAPLPQGMDAFESRGKLVRDWLTAQSQSVSNSRKARSLEEVREEVGGYLSRVEGKLDRFPGFNLLVGALSTEGTVVGYITNRTADGQAARNRKADIFLPQTSPPPPGGMSNSVLAQPWSKVLSGSTTFHSILSSSPTEDHLIEQLFDLLWTSSNPKPTQRSELRNSVLISPLELPAPNQIRDWYATRTSTVILLRKDGHAKLVERDTFKNVNGQATLVNGPKDSGAIASRNGGQRVFEWQV